MTSATVTEWRRALSCCKIARFGFPASAWRHFERLEALPRGLLPVGDAVCRFNPVYGQGMSVAAQEACVLHRLLAQRTTERDPLAGLASVFFAEVQTLIETSLAVASLDLVGDLLSRG